MSILSFCQFLKESQVAPSLLGFWHEEAIRLFTVGRGKCCDTEMDQDPLVLVLHALCLPFVCGKNFVVTFQSLRHVQLFVILWKNFS